jgi:hypothetical protein
MALVREAQVDRNVSWAVAPRQPAPCEPQADLHRVFVGCGPDFAPETAQGTCAMQAHEMRNLVERGG